jgi:HEAT repeat protein
MRWFSAALSAMALMLALPVTAKTAYAHGGQYRGPAGEVPPDSRQPEDPPPPDTGGGTPTPPDPGGGTPTPPGDGGGTPTPPDSGGTPTPPDGGGGGVPAPGGPSGTGGTKTKSPGKKGPSYDSWLFWWNYNKDDILNLKRAVRSGLQGSGGSGLSSFVDDASGMKAEEQNVTARVAETKVVPILLEYAESKKLMFDIHASAVLGLAKMRQHQAEPLMMTMAKNEGTDQFHKVVEETAALALGVMQHNTAEVRDFLGKVATNASAKTRTRCFAAFSLGLLGGADAGAGAQGSAESYAVLKSLVSSGGEASREIAASALVAIGLLGDRSAIPDLVQWLNEEKAGANKLNDLQLSYVAAALGKIGQPGLSGPDSREVIDALRQQLNRRNRMTRYSVMIAFGQIGPNADEKIQRDCVGYLSEIVTGENKSGNDTQSVNFALISLGRIAGVAPGPDGKGGCPEAVRTKAVERLGNAFEGGKSGSVRSFAALGLGLALMNQNESLKAKPAEIIRTALAKSSGDVEARGALCISLGLLKDIQSAPVLQSLLQDKGADKKLRGTAALALGLIGDKSAVDVVRKALMEKEDRELRVDAAMAAGLLKDNQAVEALVEVLKDPKASQFILGSVATALGQIGDQRAIDPLVQILRDEKYPDLTRALACVGLGQIGDRSDISVLSRLSKDVNYRSYYDAIGEVLTII